MAEYFDVIAIVPLEVELLEVMAVFPDLEDRSTATEFRHVVDTGRAGIRMLVAQQEDMGKASAAQTVGNLLKDYDTSLFVCLGIAGGLSSDVRLGDVCYTGKIIDIYDNAKASDGAEVALSWSYHLPSTQLPGMLLLQSISCARNQTFGIFTKNGRKNGPPQLTDWFPQP